MGRAPQNYYYKEGGLISKDGGEGETFSTISVGINDVQGWGKRVNTSTMKLFMSNIRERREKVISSRRRAE